MKNYKRALRRYHRQRMLAKARKIAQTKLLCADPEDQERWALRNYDNLCDCSCWMCGNARKHWGPTIQELKNDGF